MNPVTIHLAPAPVRDLQHRRAVTAPVDVGTLREHYRYARREGRTPTSPATTPSASPSASRRSSAPSLWASAVTPSSTPRSTCGAAATGSPSTATPGATAAYRRLRRGGTSPDAARMTVTNLLALGKHATLANFARTEQHA